MLSGLGADDLSSVVQAAECIVASTGVDELRRATVEALAGVVASPLVAWNEVCARTGRIQAVTFPVLDPVRYADLAEAFGRHAEDHPVIANHRATGDARPRAISDFMDLGAFRRTGLYCEFYRPLGARDQISFILPDPELIIGIALNSAEPSITDRERTICRLLLPLDGVVFHYHPISFVHFVNEKIVEAAVSSPDQVVDASQAKGVPEGVVDDLGDETGESAVSDKDLATEDPYQDLTLEQILEGFDGDPLSQ